MFFIQSSLVLLVMSVDKLVYAFPQAGINDLVMSVFQGMRHDFFQLQPSFHQQQKQGKP